MPRPIGPRDEPEHQRTPQGDDPATRDRDRRRDGCVHPEGRDDHREGQETLVAGADQHAVEHEHDRVERLEEGDDQQQLVGEILDGHVVREERHEPRPYQREHHAEADAHDEAPLEHPPGHRARLEGVLGTEGASDHGLGGDRERVE